MSTILALAYQARIPGYRALDAVVLRLRPHDRATYRSRCDDAAIVALVEYLCETGRIRWENASNDSRCGAE